VARIPEETLQAIRDRVDLVDLVGRHVNLKKSGRNFVGLCPFHDEKTPSFHVHVDRQIYHCFGCGEGGNAISFLIQHENLTFPEAARALAREVGIEIPEHAESGEPGLSERLRAANQIAQDLYREALASPEAAPARDYLARRGLEPADLDRFGVGFAPRSGRALLAALERRGVPVALGEKAGLLGRRERVFDMLRGRITFPIQDARGQVLGFGGRALSDDQTPKYLNTPESPVYRKREVFYGLHHALSAMRRTERAVVVEGYFDRLAMHRAGVEEAVATCGTALTAEHARQIARRTRRVVLVFDGDEAGQRAVDSSLAVLLPAGLRVEAVLLPGGEDPDDLLAREGADALRARVGAAVPALDLVMRRAVARGCATPWQKADAVAAVAPLLALVPDGVERGELVRRLALAVDAEPDAVEQAVARSRRGGEEAAREALPAPARRADRRVRWAQDLVAALLAEPALARIDLGGKGQDGGHQGHDQADEPAPGHQPHLHAHEHLLSLVPESPARRALALALAAASAVGAAGRVDVGALDADGEDAAALAVLRAAALDDRFAEDREAAARVFRDVAARLEDAAHRDALRDGRRRHASREMDDDARLELAQRSLERRRERARPRGSGSDAAMTR